VSKNQSFKILDSGLLFISSVIQLSSDVICHPIFEVMQREDSTAKSNVSSKMLFILQVLRELTLPLLTDTEITCTGLDIKR